ncbi:dual specificity protein phosphatase 19a [Chiloscyllium plagiosum]|uniref:dual specificity protein phosphatase 19a n=1 Tax=Chiloscyllium plagiosum TaxID=36176 RepID=UPI001CB82A11|nr:dual specificity protein phosphatase 19a [Chiloscyllium plagiosum]
MHSLANEIQAFSKASLKKQSTRVTTITGKRLIETLRDARMQIVEDAQQTDGACGYVEDTSLDLNIGAVKPWLMLASQDVAHDYEKLKDYKISHILNVGYGVENAFPCEFIYKSITILDIPETCIISFFPECFEFIDQAKEQNGVVLVHCNAGVSRSASIVIGYLMWAYGLSFKDAFSTVKNARQAINPNPGFMEQLRNYQPKK